MTQFQYVVVTDPVTAMLMQSDINPLFFISLFVFVIAGAYIGSEIDKRINGWKNQKPYFTYALMGIGFCASFWLFV